MAISKKAELIKKDFDMNSVSSCVFHHSQWESCTDEEHASIPYLIYRVLFMIIFISSLTFSTLCQSYLYHIFLTNWSFTLQTLYGTLFCVNILWKKRYYLGQTVCSKLNHIYPETNVKTYELKETKTWGNSTGDETSNEDGKEMMACVNVGNNVRDEEQNNSTTALTTDSALRKSDAVGITINTSNNNNDSPDALEKVIWILMNIAHVLPHIVALGYWIFVYKYDPKQPPCEKFKSHFIVHGAASVLALIDSLIVAVPARKTHFIFPSFLLFVYVIFSYMYEAAGGPYREGKEFIYSILNWRYNPGKTVILVLVGVLLSPLVHLVTCWVIHLIRLRLVSTYKRLRK